jgi:hypothetical protein
LNSPQWNEVRTAWEVDGTWRDIYIHSTQEADWQRVLDLIRSRWSFAYSEGGERVQMPKFVDEIFGETPSENASFLTINPANGIRINCHFFTPEEIEFDLDPREVQDQSTLDVVADFVQAIAHITDKLAIVCYENMPDTRFMWFDPSTGSFGVSVERT